MTDICPNCHAGALRVRRVAYAAWHLPEGTSVECFVVVPRVPARLCDVCGSKFFEAEAIERLALLLGPVSDLDDNTHLWQPCPERSVPSFDSDLDLGRVQ
jgi:YgiT-type zinc finger domain-containing protein